MYHIDIQADGRTVPLYFKLDFLSIYDLIDKYGNLADCIKGIAKNNDAIKLCEFINTLITDSYCVKYEVSAPDYTKEVSTGFMKTDIDGTPCVSRFVNTPAHRIFLGLILRDGQIFKNFMDGLLSDFKKGEC